MKKKSKEAVRLAKKKRSEMRGHSRRVKRASIGAEGQSRQFRQVKCVSVAKLTVASALTGNAVHIPVRSMNDKEKRNVSSACDFINRKLDGTEYYEPLQIVTKVTGILVTKSPHVGAYSGMLNEEPIVILNEAIFGMTNDEFAVTILHELLHLITTPGDRDPTSMYEVWHDLQCYALLRVNIPADHWAFKKYPELKEELMRSQALTTESAQNSGS